MNVFIPCLPVSVNQAYATDFRTKRRFKTKKYLEFEKTVHNRMVIKYSHSIKSLKEKKLEVIIELFGNWFNKNGTIKNKDVCNYEKTLIDVLAKELDFSDSQIFSIQIIKEQSKEESTIISFYDMQYM